jgi:hypothetical protein
MDGAQLDPRSTAVLEPCDLAIGKLLNFDSTKVPNYPVFKDPSQNFEPGVSLCRLGFPFYNVGTVYDPSSGFRLVNTPLPIFPNEGILSRMHKIQFVDPSGSALPPPPFPLRMIETSSPGIKGQSGGPIFDQDGVIWAIQSATTSYPMDFSTKVEQYYHVGVGVSSIAILGLLRHFNVKFAISTN